MKYSYNENPARVGTVVPFGRTDMTKLIVAFYKHVNVPKELSVNTTYGNNNFYYLIHIYIYINTHTYVYIYIYIYYLWGQNVEFVYFKTDDTYKVTTGR